MVKGSLTTLWLAPLAALLLVRHCGFLTLQAGAAATVPP